MERNLQNAANDLLAQALANADAAIQAEVLNTFVHHLGALCRSNGSGGYGGTIGTQAFYIAEHLKPETTAFLSELCQSYDYIRADTEKTVRELKDEESRLRTTVESLRRREAEFGEVS